MDVGRREEAVALRPVLVLLVLLPLVLEVAVRLAALLTSEIL